MGGAKVGAWLVILCFAGSGATGCAASSRRARQTFSVPHTEVAEGRIREALLHLERVHFALDSAALGPDARAALRRAAEVLREHPEVNVQIEGYADPRGANEYNLGLGQSRAVSVARYLEDLSVPGERLRTVSYGEERSYAGTDSRSLARNRRVDFRLMRGRAQLVLDDGSLLDDRGQRF